MTGSYWAARFGVIGSSRGPVWTIVMSSASSLTSAAKAQRPLEAQVRILKLIAKDSPVGETLAALTGGVEELGPSHVGACAQAPYRGTVVTTSRTSRWWRRRGRMIP
jgi:hypothetical protein